MEEVSVSYVSFDRAVGLVHACGVRALLVKFDILSDVQFLFVVGGAL